MSFESQIWFMELYVSGLMDTIGSVWTLISLVGYNNRLVIRAEGTLTGSTGSSYKDFSNRSLLR